MTARTAAGLVIAGLFLTTQPALADKIDGNWCSAKGKSISVDGSNVVTPGGRSIVANYTRHHVDFIIPEGEAGAGDTFSADQLNHEEISVSIIPQSGTDKGQAEIWTVCKPIS